MPLYLIVWRIKTRQAVLKHAQSRRFAPLKTAGLRGALGLRRFTAAFTGGIVSGLRISPWFVAGIILCKKLKFPSNLGRIE